VYSPFSSKCYFQSSTALSAHNLINNKLYSFSVLSIFNIVKFNNDACTAASGGSVLGTCYTAGECTALGGTADGACASSFGVCCTGIQMHILIVQCTWCPAINLGIKLKLKLN